MGSSSPSKTTQKQEMDPWLKDQIQGNLDDIRNLDPYEKYEGDAIAPQTPEYSQMLENMGKLGNYGAQSMGKGLSGLNDLSGLQANQIWAPLVNNSGNQLDYRNVGGQEIGTVGKGLQMQGSSPMTSPAEVQAQQMRNPRNVYSRDVNLAEADINKFLNPYTDEVVNKTLDDVDRSRQMAVNRGEDQALMSGAFGGSRHGIADAETNRGFADRAAAAAGNLRNQGFNTALGAAQNEQGMDLQGQMSNQQADLQGQLANQQAGMQADRWNQTADLQSQLANQQAGMQTDRWNQQDALQRALANQQTGLQGQMANQQAGMQLGRWNQMAGMQGQLANQQAMLGAQQANQSANLDAGRLNLLANQGLLGTGQGMLGMGQQAAQTTQDRAQSQADFDYQEAMREQMDPRELLQLQTAAIQGIPTMGTTTGTQPGGSRLGGGIGGAMSGAGMGAQLGSVVPGFGTGMGAMAGGGLGLLGGMFG